MRSPPTKLAGSTDRRMDALLTVLADNPMITISGERIAQEMHVSRSAVWWWTQRLRELGVQVKGQHGMGYRIERVPDVLSPTLLRRQMGSSPFLRRIHHFFKTSSTNITAFELGQGGEPHGTLVIAEEQTAGRGRSGRSWHSERANGVYMSVLLRPPISPLHAPLLTLLAGLALRDSILEETGLAPDLRWPNDVLLAGKKCCGILSEMQAEPDRVHFLVTGIGVNVNHTSLPEEISGLATSLRMITGRLHSRLQIVVRLLRKLESYYNQFVNEGPAPIVERFQEVSSFARGKRVRISTPVESYVGMTEGLEPHGLLRVRRGDGRVETVISGDVAEVP
jgi:BirA family biotin operon repressor/biotin-[acetyl-CoA-carboxylase] ligase